VSFRAPLREVREAVLEESVAERIEVSHKRASRRRIANA
jgi:hypothetical protein